MDYLRVKQKQNSKNHGESKQGYWCINYFITLLISKIYKVETKDMQYFATCVVIGAMICFALLHCTCDMKVTQLNVSRSLIYDVMFYELRLSDNTTNAIRNISCAEGAITVNYSRVTRYFNKFHAVCKKLTDQALVGLPKAMDSEAVLQAIELNSKSIRWASHLTIQNDSSLSWPWQKHPKLPNCSFCY